MDFYEMFELENCPECGGTGLLEEECGNVFTCTCLDCGSHTIDIGFKDEAGKREAAERVAYLWNLGKIISSARGE